MRIDMTCIISTRIRPGLQRASLMSTCIATSRLRTSIRTTPTSIIGKSTEPTARIPSWPS
jgi:hypothetical protein